jgi:flavin-dependent dehydrogenase
MLPKNFKIENLKGGTLPVFPLEKTYTDRVMICGDAAGFVNSITGEGIYYAMASGEIAADVATMALHASNTSEQYLSQYQRFWMKEFGKDLKFLGRFNKRWGQDSEKIVRLLQNNPLFAKLLIGVTGGRLSISKYQYFLFLSYLVAIFKDIFYKK